MNHIKQFFRSILTYQPAIVLLLAGLAYMLGYLAYESNVYADLTQNKRNTISMETKKVLDRMPNNIEIKAVVSNNQINGKYFKKSIQSFLARYQRHKSNIHISYLLPERDMREIRKLGLKQEGDWLVEYDNQREYFALPYTDERFTNLLIKIQSVNTHVFFFTDGHLEPQLNDPSPEGLHLLTKAIGSNGLQATQSSQLSYLTNTHVLIINAPNKAFSLDEIGLIEHHINQGGNVVWLMNSDNLQGLERIAENLGIEISSGIVLDLSNQSLGLDSRLVGASNYASHEIFSDFTLRSYFLNARRVGQKENLPNSWNIQNLIGVAENGWLTKKEPLALTDASLSNNILKSGPINIAVALRRQVNQQEQRIVIIGNQHFLSNEFIEQGGNKSLAIRILKWASAKYTPLSIQQRITKDAVVVIGNDRAERYWILSIFNGFQFLLPLLLLITATLTWYRRSRS